MKFFKTLGIFVFFILAFIKLLPQPELKASHHIPFHLNEEMNFEEFGKYEHIDVSKLGDNSLGILFTPNDYNKYDYDYDSYIMLYYKNKLPHLIITTKKMDSKYECQREANKLFNLINIDNDYVLLNNTLSNSSESVYFKCEVDEANKDYYIQNILYSIND